MAKLNSPFFLIAAVLVFALSLTGCAGRSGSLTKSGTPPSDFAAYYTRVNSGESFERFSRTGEYADVVVRLWSDGQFVFWRGSSYLPYWETSSGQWYVDEIVPRSGDGSGMRPDRVNTYSYVRIVESSPQQVVVHWRYLPDFAGENPHTDVDAAAFVDEYFVITPDGAVTRTIKQGTEKIDDWDDPLNITTQALQLTSDGILDRGITEPASSAPGGPADGNPVRTGVVGRPVAWWKFDEAQGDSALESVSGESCTVEGHKSLWKAGVSGTALQFDGYTNVVSLPASKSPVISSGLTLEAWVAVGAYPWHWAPIVHRGDDAGYFLGVSSHGRVGFKVRVEDSMAQLSPAYAIPLSRWVHVAGTFDKSRGTMSLYVDGVEIDSRTVPKSNVATADYDVQIGKGRDYAPVGGGFRTAYSFDGLVDEVKIYDVALSPSEVERSYNSLKPDIALRDNPDMDMRGLPTVAATGRFGARYTKLRFYETWDNMWRVSDHADVVVGFDELPIRFVFWRGTGYVPAIVNKEDQWYTNSFNETWGDYGCMEPMSDKLGYHNHVRIIENTDARVVVHWRYPLIDVFHTVANYDASTGWGDWSDWYYYIYPDGVAVKRMHLWSAVEDHEWQETTAILGPGQHPEGVIEIAATLTMANTGGESADYSWNAGHPPVFLDQPEWKNIQQVNYTADYDPFTIGDFEEWDSYFEVQDYSVFPTWNHWPVAQILSDGRDAISSDRTSHSSLGHVVPAVYARSDGEAPWMERLLMEGMSNASTIELVPLASSWLNPPSLSDTRWVTSQGYDQAQRAYVLTADGSRVSFRLKGSGDSPIVNPAFVIKNWGSGTATASLKIDGVSQMPGPDFRQGIIVDTDGTYTLIIWLDYDTTSPTSFEISQQ